MSTIGTRQFHAEHDSIVVGKLGFGEPRWAHATTHPIRPEVGRIRHQFQPIKSLRSIKPFAALPTKAHNPASVVLPGSTKQVVADNDIDKTFKIQRDYWKHLGVDLSPDQAKPKPRETVGVLEYDHKTAPRLVQMTPEQAKECDGV